MPKHVHRAIAEKAGADDMSLNAYIVTVLAMDLAQRVQAAIHMPVSSVPFDIDLPSIQHKFATHAARLVEANAAVTAAISGNATISLGPRGALSYGNFSYGTAVQGVATIGKSIAAYRLPAAQLMVDAAHDADTTPRQFRKTG